MADLQNPPGEPASAPAIAPAAPAPRRRSPWRWVLLSLGLLAALFAAALAAAIHRYTPLLRIDERNDRVVLLGGLIDLDAKSYKFRLGEREYDGSSALKRYEGRRPVRDPKAVTLKFVFLSGVLELHPAVEPVLLWKCATVPVAGAPSVSESGGVMKLDIHDSAGARCEIWVPDGMKAEVEGSVGKVVIEDPGFPLVARVGSGNILFTPDPKRKYRIAAVVQAGQADRFESSEEPSAIPIALSVVNGRIKNEPR